MWSWAEEVVGREQPHLVLRHDDHASPVALVGPAIDGRFVVQFLVPRESDDEIMRSVVSDVVREIDFYLLEVGGPDPWAYAIYHCGTASNVHSRVHWGYSEPSG